MNSKKVGDVSVANIIAKLLEFGYVVSVPFGDSLRYDLIVDIGVRLLRVQCKTARIQNDYLLYNHTSITTKNGKRVSISYTNEEIDLLLVWSPDLCKVYSVPLEEFAQLRLEPTKNGQQAKVRWAKDYEFNGDVV